MWSFLFAAIKFYHPTDAYKFRPVRVAYLCGARGLRVVCVICSTRLLSPSPSPFPSPCPFSGLKGVLLPTLRTNQIQSVAKRKTSWACRKGGRRHRIQFGFVICRRRRLICRQFCICQLNYALWAPEWSIYMYICIYLYIYIYMYMHVVCKAFQRMQGSGGLYWHLEMI